MPSLRAVAARELSAVPDADVLAVPVARGVGEEGPQPRAGTADAAVAYGIDLAAVCERARFTGAAGGVLPVPGARPAPAGDGAALPPSLLLVGTGAGTPQDLRRAGAALARAVRGRSLVATPVVADAPAAGVQAFAEGALLGSYHPPRSGLSEGPEPAVGALALLGCTAEAPLERASTGARATWRVRDLAATPSSTKSPQWVAEQARLLAGQVDGVGVEVLDERELTALGFGGLLAVGAGSATPPRLVRATFTPRRPPSALPRHVVLVGKGITFDTGGLSIKPREAMVPMKTDMTGAAVVLAALLGAAELDLPHRVTALLPLAENAFGASSYRPGDVVTTFAGTTVEVANTDAEGRMVLADALSYADAELGPDLLVDVATLTGAASLGLGKRHAALFTADDALAAGLEAAADDSGERVWRMPLVEDYRPALDSEVADLRHVPAESPGAGAVTAALFLREFTGSRTWAHLDVAGPARADRDEHEVTKGATGFGARLLLRWLEGLA
ncbi:M17 family metallopeptidase [Quadrisphaera sp. DSM 44207]|uniref:leucyl aminopeptidase family protein n=1 Tax=Quadrisphaera sp. DSM 44207 TaxID=1881057 RepID=UPI000B861231|nr:M17 family peptidase N-terminal domain-containing protein [Quadrisphaera sp. DSM 44207]